MKQNMKVILRMSKKYKNTVKQNKKRQIKKLLNTKEYFMDLVAFNEECFLSLFDIKLNEDRENVLEWEVTQDNKAYLESEMRCHQGQIKILADYHISRELGREMVQVGLIRPLSRFSWDKGLPPWIPEHRLKPKLLKKVLMKWVKIINVKKEY